MDRDDYRLLEGLRQRDPAAFTVVFDLYADKLYRLALGIVKNEDEAEGVVQDTFTKLITTVDRFEGRAKIGTWLYRVAYNRAIDRVRARRPTVAMDADNADGATDLPAPVTIVDWTHAPESMFDSSEAREQIHNSIAELSEPLRAVFILREIEGLSTAETAEALGISPGAVKVRLHRARLQLRETLTGYFGEIIATEEQDA